jgi:hypothetical protein
MKKQYEAPIASSVKVDTASFLSTSGDLGDAVAVDVFEGSYGKSF